MEKQLEAFRREIEVISKMINGYLSTNPDLAGFVLNSISIKPVEDLERKMEFVNSHKHASLLSLDDVAPLANSCLLCRWPNGDVLPHCGPGGCPPPSVPA